MRYARQSHGNNISNTKSYWEYIIICAVQHTQLDERVSCMQGLIRCAREYVRSGEASAVTVTLIKMYEAYFIEMWDALGNNPLLFSYFFYYRLRYIYKISNDNLQVDFDEGTIPPASAPAISCYDFFAHTRTTSTHTSTCIHTIYIPKIIAHMALCVEQQARERENTSHKCSIFCVLSRAFLFIDWQFQYFSPTSSHMPKTPFILRHCYEFRVWNAIRCCADCSACWMYIIFIHLQPFLFHAHWSAFFFHIRPLSLSASASHTWAWCVKPSRFNP